MDKQVADCFICRKHRREILVPGGPVFEDDLLYAGHASVPQGEKTGYLGALLVEPRRHVADLGELTDVEAQRAGVLIAHLAKSLKSSEGAEHVYLFVLGHHVDHLHIWLVPRYPGTPREYWGMQVDEWPGAPRGGPEEIAALCQRLRDSLTRVGPTEPD